MWTVRRTSVSNIVHKFTNKLKWSQLKQCSYLEIVKIPNLQPHVDSDGIKVLSCAKNQALRASKLSRHGHIDKIILKNSSVLLFAVFLLADAKTNSLLFFPSNMASKMTLQSDMLSFLLISRPITAPIKKNRSR